MITLARELGLVVEETTFARDELYLADEVFLTGTAAEITPVREIDDRQIGAGECGPVTRKLQDAFFEAVKGTRGQGEGRRTPSGSRTSSGLDREAVRAAW